MMHHKDRDQSLGGTFLVDGVTPIQRIGYGAMQLTGPGHWQMPKDMQTAKDVLRKAIQLGINHIDTSDAYGPHSNEELIKDALYPYPENLVIASKGGMIRTGPNKWIPLGRPDYLRQCVELSLRRLKLERIPIYYLHRIDPFVSFEDQVGVLEELKIEGKIKHIGLSKVSVSNILRANKIAHISMIQNRFNPIDDNDDVLRYCDENNIGFVGYAPFNAGALLTSKSSASSILSWFLRKSSVAVAIPGTSNVQHLEENLSSYTATDGQI